MKLLIKLYSNSFCSIIKAEAIEIKSNKITVYELKEQISAKFHIPISEQILTIKYENTKKNNIITLSDEFPLYYFFVHNNSEIYLEHFIKIDKTKEICEKIKNTKNRQFRYLKKLPIFSNKINSRRNLAIIKESDNEYTETDLKNNDEIKNAIISQAIQFIIENKITQFKEYIYINEFIQKDLSILTTKENGWNALHYSCYYGGEQITEFLIKLFNPSKELINGLTKDGYTPLHLACIKGHANIVRILLLFFKEIDVNINHKVDGTPLHIACKRNDTQIVSILVSSKADLYKKDYNDQLPIELTTDENIKKILKKAMIHILRNDESVLILEENDLSLSIYKSFTPPKPPITIGQIEKRGQIFPIYDSIFIEVNPSVGLIKKYNNSKKYPDKHFGAIDLYSVSLCKREFPDEKDYFYFSIIYSSKEIYRVKNEESFKRWVKVINESIIYCKYWKKIKENNKNAYDRQKNIIEIIEENGKIKNYEEEQKKKEDIIKEKEREKALQILNDEGKSLKNNKSTIVSLKNSNDTSNLDLELIDDSNKKGINSKSFEKLDLLYNYSYGKVYKVRLKRTKKKNLYENNVGDDDKSIFAL